MRAIELLNGTSSRCVKFKYKDKVWSGIRVSQRRRDEVSKVEISRVEGVIGALTGDTLEIGPDTEVFLDGEKPRSKNQKGGL